MKIFFFILLFLSLSANIFCQADRFDQMSFWTDSKVQNVATINSENEEFSPYIWGEYLIYVGSQEKKGIFKNNKPDYFDLKASLLEEDATLNNFIFTAELNGPFHEGPLSWSEADRKIYFTRANSEDGQAVIDEFGRQLLQIYQADYAQGKWENISKLSFSVDTVNFCHPAIFSSGDKMIFASSKDGGSGKMDLYFTEKNPNQSWKIPVTMEGDINQPGNQWFPFVLDGEYLFYASDVGDGQGLDIYYAPIENEMATQKPQRLPYPINTAQDDFGLIISGDRKTAYLSSNRMDSKGKDDIYEVIFPAPRK